MSGLQLTRRGYRVLGVAAAIMFLAVLGFAGWIEGLTT